MNMPWSVNPEPTTKAPEAASSASADSSPVGQIRAKVTEAAVIEAIRTCYDPEIPVNIYDLGLIYRIDVSADGRVAVDMTLTSPMCPVAGSLPPAVQEKVKAVEGVTDATVNVVWDPPWTPDKMSDAARLQLNLF